MQDFLKNALSGHFRLEEKQNIVAELFQCIKSLFQLTGHDGLITSASKMSSGFDFPEVSKVTNQNLPFLCSKEI